MLGLSHRRGVSREPRETGGEGRGRYAWSARVDLGVVVHALHGDLGLARPRQPEVHVGHVGDRALELEEWGLDEGVVLGAPPGGVGADVELPELRPAGPGVASGEAGLGRWWGLVNALQRGVDGAGVGALAGHAGLVGAQRREDVVVGVDDLRSAARHGVRGPRACVQMRRLSLMIS